MSKLRFESLHVENKRQKDVDEKSAKFVQYERGTYTTASTLLYASKIRFVLIPKQGKF